MRKDIRINQNASFSFAIPLEYANGDPISNVTGFTARSQMRREYSNNLPLDFTVVLSSETLTISLSANQTASLEPERYLYDVLLVDPDGIVTRIREGCVDVTPGVTE